MIKYIFSHLLWSSMILAMFATVVKELDTPIKNATFIHLLKRMIVASGSGMLFFFITFDYRDVVTPSKVLAGALLMGYCGSTLFNKLIEKYNLAIKQDEKVVTLKEKLEAEPPAFLIDDSVTKEDLKDGSFDYDEDEIGVGEIDEPWLDEDNK